MSLKFTVVTAVFNAEDVIEKTIKSVLNQTYTPYEYLIIDGKSSDKTVEIERAGGKEMNTRIIELIKRYNLQSCVYTENESLEKLGTYNIDEVNKILENERICADDYYKQFAV